MPWPTTSRQSRGYGADWDRLRQQVMRRDNRLCQPCLRKTKVTPATEVDHITPKAKGGTDDSSNLEAICSPCHKAKTAAENGGKPKTTIGEDGWPVHQ